MWFFDRAKTETTRDRVLFLDASNYYTVVDRSLNEWSEWQLKNLNAIVWLYRGEKEKYQALLDEYRKAIRGEVRAICDLQTGALALEMTPEYYEDVITIGYEAKNMVEDGVDLSDVDTLKELLSKFLRLQKAKIPSFIRFLEANKNKHDIKALIASHAGRGSARVSWYKQYMQKVAATHEKDINACIKLLSEAKWLVNKFGEGEYRDIPGLCKVAYTTKEARGQAVGVSIEEKGWSLTPGTYVGMAPQADDGMGFAARMREIHAELLSLQTQSNALMDTISKNMEEMGL